MGQVSQPGSWTAPSPPLPVHSWGAPADRCSELCEPGLILLKSKYWQGAECGAGEGSEVEQSRRYVAASLTKAAKSMQGDKPGAGHVGANHGPHPQPGYQHTGLGC